MAGIAFSLRISVSIESRLTLPGSADLCLITTDPPSQRIAELAAHGVPIEEVRCGTRAPAWTIGGL